MDRSGIFAQAGFAFQLNVFLKQVTELTPGAVARYEYLDDISASTGLDELSGQIGLCETQLFQVKNTNVSKKDVIQIYTNWILADCEQESISSFWLLYSDQKTLSEFFNAITAGQFIEMLDNRAEKSNRSNAAKLKATYSKDEIVRYFSRVKKCACARPINEDKLNAEIRDGLASPFHLTSDVDLFNERIAELKRVIHYNIADAMLKASPYEIGYESFMQLCEQICEKISSNRFEPDILHGWLLRIAICLVLRSHRVNIGNCGPVWMSLHSFHGICIIRNTTVLLIMRGSLGVKLALLLAWKV